MYVLLTVGSDVQMSKLVPEVSHGILHPDGLVLLLVALPPLLILLILGALLLLLLMAVFLCGAAATGTHPTEPLPGAFSATAG